ncbi:MAG: lytic transglycosylase domain-containing protein [Alphaproteobacteria bacterium]|nr:MAG: lytic transglycosylase domain-containing protein [Alphaproteobacteria bacterium]
MRSVYALLPAALLAGTVLAAPAEAKGTEDPGVHAERVEAQKKYFKIAELKKSGKIRKIASLKTRRVATVKAAKVASAKTPKTAHVKIASAKTSKIARVKMASAKIGKLASLPEMVASKTSKFAAFNTMGSTETLRSGPRQIALQMAGIKMNMSSQALAIKGANDIEVASIIREMAPSYGVPTWFALRIANVESGFNPYARGSAGEIGIYQLKCETARGMGFEGDCSQLTDIRTNVRWGLKHLSLAIESSGGNLMLAASKHNAGLGHKSLVHSYIAKVF